MRFVFYGAFFFIFINVESQTAYFQQEVNYKINVQLNDSIHSLKGFEELEYINNSPQTLNYIYFHLWPNAYKNNETALCKQLVAQGKTDLFFSNDGDRGYIDSLNFKINGRPIKIEFDSVHSDICKLILNEPLKSLDSILISTPFYVKIPDARFSRLGHSGQAYYITQWYPKPAVFDNEGWHAMPYLDQGEFYSEFGSFDVSITLPDNYVLASTGDRIDALEEERFLNNRVKQTLNFIEKNQRIKDGMMFPPSSKKFKTIRFKQYRVHDFAWFADKRFYALHDQIELPESKRIVDTWAFFTDKNIRLWKNAISYINESTTFYSQLVGDYPYNHVTAIDGTIMAGGGMEYPEITVIGDMDNCFDLDVTIAHEVGHNWFYGILANNERRYPFMDEGINSFYEMRYIRSKYPNKNFTHYVGLDSASKIFRLNKTHIWKEKEMAFLMSLSSNSDQSINITSEAFTPSNYGTMIYGKTALAFDYLMEYMGENTFDAAMKTYFEKFKFKHPQPKDLYQVLAGASNNNLDWFEQNFISSTNRFDYKIKSVKGSPEKGYQIKMINKTGSLLPLNICGYKNNQLVGIIWYDGFKGKRTVEFPPQAVDYFKIDGQDKLPEINRRNNYSKTKGLFKKWKPLQFNLIGALENPTKNQINYLPIFGGNFYDGSLIGIAIHNYGFYKKKFDYLIAPFYATNTKQLNGYTQVDYNLFPKKSLQQITIGSKLKSFNYDVYKPNSVGIKEKNQYLTYYKIENYLLFQFKKKPATSLISQSIKLSNTNLFIQNSNNQFVLDSSGIKSYTLSKIANYSYVNQINYELQNKRSIDPFRFVANLQQAAIMSKISLEINYQFTLTKKSNFELRCFLGTFLSGTQNARGYYAFRGSGYNGYDDYLFDANYIGRSERSGIGFNQFTEKDGALKVWTPLARSGSWQAAFNIKSPKIGILPIRIFADVVTCDGQYLLKDKLLWDAGINLTIVKNLVEVYVPCFYSNDIKKTLELNNIQFFNRIRFTFNIHKLVPKNFIQSSFNI